MRYIIILVVFTFLFTTTKAKTIVVSNKEDLVNACIKATKGDTVLIKDGIYNHANIAIAANGTFEQPIVLKAIHAGKVLLTGNSSLKLGGSHIVVDGLYFKDGFANNGAVVEFRNKGKYAFNSRLTNCTINGFNNIKRTADNYWLALFGQNNRIDHCTFINKLNLGVLLAVILDDDLCRNNNHSIDSNKFLQRIPLGSNAGEIIRIGVSQHCTFNSNTIIKNNLFEACDGETEIISVKSCGNIVRNNIFKECQGAVVLRHGNNNTIEQNLFWGNNKRGTGGVRIINEGNWVVNNLFMNCRGVNFRQPLVIMNGVPNSPANRYLPVKDAVISNNSFYNCTPFSLCEGSDTERSQPPQNVYFINNYFENKKDTSLVVISDDISGIKSSNNYYSFSVKPNVINGFIATAAVQKKQSTYLNLLPDSIATQTPQRLFLKSFPKIIGSSLKQPTSNQLQAITGSYGAAYFKPITSNAIVSFFNCNNVDDIKKAATSSNHKISIQLTGNNYLFTEPIIFKQQQVIISSNNKQVFFEAPNLLENIFEINTQQNTAELLVQNCAIVFKNTNATNFISSAKGGFVQHYNLRLINNSFSATDSQIKTFFNAQQSSFADSIVIAKNEWNGFSSNLFALNNEIEKKGLYAAEIIQITNNKFHNINGYILASVRGGNDESTMGPYINFSYNHIANCKASNALIDFEGVQESYLFHNNFTNSNSSGITINFINATRGKHQLKNNRFTSSGNINTNKYVTTIQ